MVVGAATPPGRLAAAIAAAAEAVRSDAEDIEVDIMNLAEVPIDTCDGRLLDGYGAETRQAVDRIAAAAAVLIAAPVYRASFPGVLKNLLDIVPVEALQESRWASSRWAVPPITISQSIRNCARFLAGLGRWSRPPRSILPVRIFTTGL
jgi:FMN reductase